MADRKHTLYANPQQTRFYWIPDDVTLPPGAYVLRSLSGARIEVDEEAADAYKITEERAKEVTREVLSKVTERAGSLLSSLGAMMQEVARDARDGGREAEEIARDRFGKLREAAAPHLETAEKTVDELGHKVKEFLDSGEAKRTLDEAGKRLEELAREVGQALRPKDKPAEPPPAEPPPADAPAED